MLRIRLSRTGMKKQASYRVVVANVESKRDGRVVERIGHYNPRMEPEEFMIQEDRALYWLSVGAQPSDAVRRLLEKQGTIGRLERVRAGETLDDVVAEYTGVAFEAAPGEEVVEAAAVAEMAAAVVAVVDEEE